MDISRKWFSNKTGVINETSTRRSNSNNVYRHYHVGTNSRGQVHMTYQYGDSANEHINGDEDEMDYLRQANGERHELERADYEYDDRD